MPKPTSLTGWWLLLLNRKAKGSVSLLAGLIGVSTRTLNKWGSEVAVPSGQNLTNLRLVAKELLEHTDCPTEVKPRKKAR